MTIIIKFLDINENLEYASKQILTSSQIFDFLVSFCVEFNADSTGTIF